MGFCAPERRDKRSSSIPVLFPVRNPRYFSGSSGPCHLLGGLEGARGIGMGRQFIPMGVGMGIMPGWEDVFYLRVVGRMGRGMGHGVVLLLLIVAFFVLAGIRPDAGLRVTGVCFGFVSR